ncbi:MAG TPA: hypothetical protein EYH34_08725 [Planctomycetes bacterium]|nr:hypothetical protein [Planctomycetota bacterium]
MNTSRDRVIKALTHQPVDRAPRDLWVPRRTQLVRGDEVTEIVLRYPNDMMEPESLYPRGRRASGRRYDAGCHTDAWGCTWRVARRGERGQVVEHPLKDHDAVAAYEPPWELLDGAHLSRVNRLCGSTSQFVWVRIATWPFHRLRLLCGTEPAVLGLAESGSIRQLLEKVHRFACQEVGLWAASDVDGVAFGDDWSIPQDPLAARPLWYEVFMPLYEQYCQIIREHDKFAFFVGRGPVGPTLVDLAQIGVDAVYCPASGLDLADLAGPLRGKITLWGGFDGSRSLRGGNPDEVRGAVRGLREALDCGRGGLIAQCTWQPDIPFANLAALLESWLEPVPTRTAKRLPRRTEKAVTATRTGKCR